MSSDSVQAAPSDRPTGQGSVGRLLDPAFGFFVWALHLVTIYVVNALFCVLGIASRTPRAGTTLIVCLVAVTIVAAVIVVIHSVRRYRQRPESENQGFLMNMAVGQDAIAAVAILWQLIPIFMTPVCR
jgi:hypothetical protein